MNRMLGGEEVGAEGSLRGSCLEDPRVRKHISKKGMGELKREATACSGIDQALSA